MPLRSIALVGLVALAAFPACAGDGEPTGNGAPGAEGTATEGALTETAPDLRDTAVKPVIERPTGTPPRRLVVENIIRGRGARARRGSTVAMHYVGVNFSNGDEFGSTWEDGVPYRVKLGAGDVVEGWERGLVGIRKGGRRKLTIPPELAYGAEGGPSKIPPNETLVVVVDAVSVKR